MRRLWWSWGAAGAVAVVAAGVLFGTGFPARSDFTSKVAPVACALITSEQVRPFGTVNACLSLGSRTPLFGGPDSEVILLLETDQGPVAVRVGYRRTGGGYTADAAELPLHRTPGLNADTTVKRLQEAQTQRGGIRPGSWRIHP